MPLDIFTNLASTTVSAGGTTAPAAGTQETWTVASSTGFPAASSSANPPTAFRVVDQAAQTEVILVINVSGTTWTVLRGAEGAPVTHTAGFTIRHVATAAVLAQLGARGGAEVNVKVTYGAMGDGKVVTDAAMTAASGVLTSATAAFTAADVGKFVMVSNASSTAITLAVKIVAVNSTTSITVDRAAKATTSAQTWKIDLGRSGTDAVTTNNSTTITSATGNFSATDVGRLITITTAGRQALISTITSYQSATQVTLTDAATRTCTAEQLVFGTDDTSALSRAFGISNSKNYLPAGIYLARPSLAAAAPALQLASGVNVVGDGWNTILWCIESNTTATSEFIGINFYNGGTIDPAANVIDTVIEDLHIKGTAVESGFLENVPNLISMNAASDLIIRNVKVSNFRSDAIYLGSGTQGAIERHNERIRIENCFFDGINNDNRNAISIIDGTDITIHNCTFKNTASATMPGAIDIEPNSASTFARVRGIRVYDNYFERCGGDTGVIGISIMPPDSTLTYAAQGFEIVNNVIYDCFNSTSAIFALQGGTATAATRPLNMLIANNQVINWSGNGGRGTNYIMEFENVIGLKIQNNIFSDTWAGIIVGYNTTCFSVEIQGNTFRNTGYGSTYSIEIVRANDFLIEDNLFYHCPGTILRFNIGSGSVGSSDYMKFISNVIRQGGSNVTTAISSRNASHTLTDPNHLAYFDNDVPNNAALGIGDFIDRTVVYTVTTGALTVDAALVPPYGTVTLNTSTTSAAGATTISNPTKGQVIVLDYVITALNQTYTLPTNVKTIGTPTHSTAAGQHDTYTVRYDGTNWRVLAQSIAVAA